MRKVTFEKRLDRLSIIARRASTLPMDEGRALIVETKMLQRFNGLLRDFLWRYAGITPIPHD